MSTGGANFWSSGALPLIEPEFLGSIISAASDIALVVSSDGVVLSVLVNDNEEGFGNLQHWEGRPVVDFLTAESVGKFRDMHASFLGGHVPTKELELNHSDNAVWQYPVRYTFHPFGHENAVLMLGRDLRPIAETQQQLVRAQIALEQGYDARREFDARYRVILNEAQDAMVFVAVQTGRVDDANVRASELLGVKHDVLAGTLFASMFSDRSGAELTESLITATIAEEVEPVSARVARTQTPILIYPTLFRAAGQRMLMCRLVQRDEAAVVPDVETSSESKYAGSLFSRGSDAMVFVSSDGEVLSANDSFLDLIGATRAADVKEKSFADFLLRGQIDLSLMLGSAERSGQMRVYATRLVNRLGAKIGVEASLTRLGADEGSVVGIVLRDTSRIESLRSGTSLTPDVPDHGHRVVELVGTASLKEIVADTTDVVEKMCIETAVQLTRNNRVAAAEMLGLSRQSLYVKLRKFGLLNKT